MTKKVFISYSHKDEEHRQDFEEHLVMLKRREIISLWHDRKITVGEDWKNSIDENLENADIIIFLVSPSFLASDYCYDVEVARAIKRKDEGSCEIISIIVRPCDWIDCEFSRFQAVPKDAKPITIWDDKDSAWLDAINGIKRHIIDFKSKKNTSIIDTVVSPKPSIEVINWVNDTEIILTHRKVNKIKLSSIYVIPNIEIESDSKSEIIKIISASELINNIGCYIVAGEEQQGKTSLLKYFFITLYENGYLPIYIDSTNIKSSDVTQVIKQSLNTQYENLSYDDYICNSKIVILVDNIDEIGLNNKFRNLFLEKLKDIFSFSILTCHSSFTYVSVHDKKNAY